MIFFNLHYHDWFTVSHYFFSTFHVIKIFNLFETVFYIIYSWIQFMLKATGHGSTKNIQLYWLKTAYRVQIDKYFFV